MSFKNSERSGSKKYSRTDNKSISKNSNEESNHSRSGRSYPNNNQLRLINDNPDRPFFDRVVSNKAKLLSATDAYRFFECAMNFTDKLELLNILTDRERCGKEALKSAFSLASITTDAANSLNNGVVKFLALLGSSSCSIGAAKMCVNELFILAFNTPGFIETILSALRDNKIQDIAAVAWFIVEISVISVSARENPLIHEIASILDKSQCPATQALSTILYPTLLAKEIIKEGNTKFASLDQLRCFEPQHNNDFPFDFRKISIVPTPEEINCNQVGASNINTSWTFNYSEDINDHKEDFPVSKEGELLDRQFRLLREDMIAPMKEEIKEEMSKAIGNRKRVFFNPHAIGIEFKPKPCILIRIDVPSMLRGRMKSMSKKQREIFMSETCRRILGRDSMVLFCDDNAKVKYVGVVTRRDDAELVSSCPQHFIIGKE